MRSSMLVGLCCKLDRLSADWVSSFLLGRGSGLVVAVGELWNVVVRWRCCKICCKMREARMRDLDSNCFES